MTRTYGQRRDITIASAFALAILSCVMGLTFCFIKSPQSRSLEYLAIAQATLTENTGVAMDAAWKAVRLDPSSQEAWQILAVSLQLNGEQRASQQARQIALHMVDPDADLPVLYAMPAEFRLSFLADTAEGL